MKAILAIARRELDGYFASPTGWLCLCGFVSITGVFFILTLYDYNTYAIQALSSPYGAQELNINEWIVAPFFANTAVILLLLCPALSMGLFAEDRKQRSLELLLSSPITTTQIVLGKYLGAMGFVSVLLAATLHTTVVLYWYGDPDPGVLAASYGATFLLAASFMAVGMLTSACTQSQVVALVLSFGLLIVLWVLSWFQGAGEGGLTEVLATVSMLTHLEPLTKGLLHLKDAVYYATFIGFFVYCTHQRVDAYRWQ